MRASLVEGGHERNKFGVTFVALFVLIYLGLYFGYSTVPDAFLRDDSYYYGIVAPSRAVINWVVPTEQVVGAENRLQSSTVRLAIVRAATVPGWYFCWLPPSLRVERS